MKRKSIYITKSFQETQFHIGGYGLQFERYFSLEYFPYGQFHAYITPTTPRSQPIEYISGFNNQGQYALYHGLAIYTEVTFVNVTLLEAGPSGGRPAVV